MLNGDDNENGFKTNRSNQQKNKLHVQHTFSSNQQKKKFARAARFFVFPLPLFCTTTTLFCTTKTSNFLVTHYFYGGIVVCVYPIFCFLCSWHVRFYFSPPLIFTLLAASISHFLTAALNFIVFLATKFVSLVFNNSLQLFLCYPHQCKHKK